MRQVLIILALVAFSTTSFCQATDPGMQTDKEYFLKKSKSQKTAAWILLGTGTTMLVTAAFGGLSFDILPTFIYGGSAAIITSVPLFIASSRNKRKAMNVAFELREIPKAETFGFCLTSQPTVTLKLHL